MNIKELKAHKRNIQLDIEKMEREYEKSKTNHILHAIISIFSIGVWLVFWFLLSVLNSSNRRKLEKMIDESKRGVMDIEGLIEEQQDV